MPRPRECTVDVSLVLVDPPGGVDYGIQRGSGADYETMSVQRRRAGDLAFEFPLDVRDNRKDGLPNFLGPFAQGPAAGRFVYVDVGTYAGQRDSDWSRRMKVPLAGITWPLIEQAIDSGGRLRLRIPGARKDGTPNCATVTPLGGWEVVAGGGSGGRHG